MFHFSFFLNLKQILVPYVQVSLLLPSEYKAGLTAAQLRAMCYNPGAGVRLHPAKRGVGGD